MRYTVLTVVIITVLSLTIFSQEVTLQKYNSTVFSQEQTISGAVTESEATGGILSVNDREYHFDINYADGTFSVDVELFDQVSDIVARVENNGGPVTSDTVRLTLGYTLRPELHLHAQVSEREVTLTVEVIENPLNEHIIYEWEEDPRNNVTVNINGEIGPSVQFTIPADAPGGEYYYNVTGVTGSGTRGFARTFVTVDSNQIVPYDIENEYAAWIDSAVVYGITPYIFVQNGKFQNITQKIPEIAELGINTLWLQPVFETYERGQGYGIIDYFKVREDLGTEQDLRDLVATAHSHGLRVLFDFIPNHSSRYHPFAQETIELGKDSHYYDFYQREFDSVPYSQHYNLHEQGFIYYFWVDLPNLNYHNPEVRRWITEAGRYWIEEFDIDGYRIDAVWGVNARYPEFMQEWRLALKRIKPEILLLGEDKASWESTFDRRFDAAYDWAAGQGWVSQWVWQTSFSYTTNPTIFNNNLPNTRANLLRNSLTNNGNGYHPDAKILRFLENNDTFRFIEHHGPERTKMAAALTFALHGIPLVFNGQEIGAETHPYHTSSIFSTHQTIRQRSQHGLFDYYKHLARIRSMFPAFHTNNFEEIPVNPSTRIFAFRRWHDDQNIFAIVNMGVSETSATITLPVEKFNLDDDKTYYLSDLITGDYYEVYPGDLEEFTFTIDGYTTTMLILDEDIVITGVSTPPVASIPQRFELLQNYPNPFNPSTTIRYGIPETAHVTLVLYDVLGRYIETLVDRPHNAGEHTEVFDASHLPSGTYFYRLTANDNSITKKMILVK
jgi:cyclomaltodextrinase / maltogenic alpha-amylase / neopullulanase